MERIRWNPIGADDADGLSVDFEAEPASSRDVDFAAIQFERTESCADVLLADDAAMPAELRMDIIEIWFAITEWRPKLWIRNTESRMAKIRIDMVVRFKMRIVAVAADMEDKTFQIRKFRMETIVDFGTGHVW